MLHPDRAREMLHLFTVNTFFAGECDAVVRLQCRHCCLDNEGGFMPRRSWIQATVFGSTVPVFMTAQRLRIFLEAIGQLCAHRDFSWRDCYTTFW